MRTRFAEAARRFPRVRPGESGGIETSAPPNPARSLTVKTGQAHVHRYTRPLLQRIENGEIDPSFVISHHLSLDEAPKGYEMFKHKQDNCTKVVLTP